MVSEAGEERTDNFRHLEELGRATMAEVMCVPEDSIPVGTGTIDDLATKVVFGDLWNRPGLSRRERRIVTLTVLTMLGRDRIHGPLHVQAALDSGDLTAGELREVAVQMAYYAGWPLATSLSWLVDEATKEGAE
ncbi:carboxymuconolactone decarboxylase family protein [Streptomyces sp. NPDC088725]|uniref:carboxymuconolactone decarboxylase family protein n=1 Tax=Streptomyces sp. NPDC088725 TaxID=3365873 RepID=UPI0037F4CBD8